MATAANLALAAVVAGTQAGPGYLAVSGWSAGAVGPNLVRLTATTDGAIPRTADQFIHDNVIVVSGPAVTGAVEDDNNSAIFNAGGNRFSANTYYLGSVAASHFSWADADVNWEEWLAFGNDRRGRAEPLNSAAGGLRTTPASGSALLPASSP